VELSDGHHEPSEVLVPHANARLTERGRLILCQRIEAGRPVAHVAAEMGISRQCAYRWWRRYRQARAAGSDPVSALADRSSRPRRTPSRTKRNVERKICNLRRRAKLGPARIGARLGVPPSTVHAVLVRHGLQRLAWLDRPTGEVIRRYQRDRPGELVHMDIKKLGKLPEGGGWRAHGRGSEAHKASRRAGLRVSGYDYVHSVVDDHSRVAYSEILPDEQAATVVAFWARAHAWYAARGIVIERVLTDNGPAYRSGAFNALLVAQGVKHKYTRPYRPQTNGKVERFNRTLLEEWAYVRTYTSGKARIGALRRWLHRYNYHRCHTALGRKPPMSRVTNLPGQYT
jgi:transposase InsO family protein